MDKIIFKKWAFQFTIWLLIINAIIFYLLTSFFDSPTQTSNLGEVVGYLGLLSSLLLVLNVIFISVSTFKKEEKNYEY